jgi:hypothetical protein
VPAPLLTQWWKHLYASTLGKMSLPAHTSMPASQWQHIYARAIVKLCQHSSESISMPAQHWKLLYASIVMKASLYQHNSDSTFSSTTIKATLCQPKSESISMPAQHWKHPYAGVTVPAPLSQHSSDCHQFDFSLTYRKNQPGLVLSRILAGILRNSYELSTIIFRTGVHYSKRDCNFSIKP